MALPEEQAALSSEERFYQLEERFTPALREVREVTKDSVALGIDEDSRGRIEVELAAKPPGAWQWTTTGPRFPVMLKETTEGIEVTDSTSQLPMTEAGAAHALRIDRQTWDAVRAAVERGIAEVSRTQSPSHTGPSLPDVGITTPRPWRKPKS